MSGLETHPTVQEQAHPLSPGLGAWTLWNYVQGNQVILEASVVRGDDIFSLVVVAVLLWSLRTKSHP